MQTFEELKNKIKECEEAMLKIMIDSLEKNEHFISLKNKISKHNYDTLTTNELGGVDYCFDLDDDLIENLLENSGATKNILLEALSALLEDHGHVSSDKVTISTCDEIFLSDSKIILPNKTVLKDQDDFHAWLLIEDYMLSEGYYPGIYSVDYYGNCKDYRFDQNYQELFPDNEKERLSKINEYLSLYSIRESLDSNIAYVSDISEVILNKISDVHHDSVIDTIEIYPTHLKLEVVNEDEETTTLAVNIIENSMRFMKED